MPQISPMNWYLLFALIFINLMILGGYVSKFMFLSFFKYKETGGFMQILLW